MTRPAFGQDRTELVKCRLRSATKCIEHKILCLNYSRMDTCPFVAGEDAAVMALGDVP